ncbi:hypothetical protein SISNIDRAFT_489075 [Sistotremastrum niveocremeum HHB9708]|uniref:LysM domain-containing protein n=1 Tax=Sistotremastrum niveocremeum HHB9708 TaxID=1314777 RepID=A0A164QH09_9AGAM|nr:hypothetical protein SISNIDRAFT_489075 [Sistotremastrum niveocremeum HHB9708]
MKSPHSFLTILCVFHVLFITVGASSNFHNKINDIQKAHNHKDAAHRIADLAAAAALVSSSSSISVTSTTSKIASSSVSSSKSTSSSLSVSFSTKSATSLSGSSTKTSGTGNSTATSSATPAIKPAIASNTTSTTPTTFQIWQASNLPTAPAPPSACASALTAPVSCNASIQLLGANPYTDAGSLAAMCTSECSSSLVSYRSTVVSACGKYMFPGPNNVTYAPTLAIDTISGPYSEQCLTDTYVPTVGRAFPKEAPLPVSPSQRTTDLPNTEHRTSGKFCNSVLPTYNTTSPSSGILSYPHSELCTSCVLGTLQSTLENPLSFSSSLYGTLQSALSLCGSTFSTYNVSSTAPPAQSSSGPSTIIPGSNSTTSPSCNLTGRNITTSGTNTTCTSLSSQYSISSADVLLNNPTISALNCTAGIASGTKLCLPQACTTYTVPANATCNSVVSAVNAGGLAGKGVNITYTQLLRSVCLSLPPPLLSPSPSPSLPHFLLPPSPLFFFLFTSSFLDFLIFSIS